MTPYLDALSGRPTWTPVIHLNIVTAGGRLAFNDWAAVLAPYGGWPWIGTT